MSKEKLSPVHPGEVLMEELLKLMGLSQNRLALNMGMSPQFWLGLQCNFDLDVAADEMGERLIEEVKIRAKAG